MELRIELIICLDFEEVKATGRRREQVIDSHSGRGGFVESLVTIVLNGRGISQLFSFTSIMYILHSHPLREELAVLHPQPRKRRDNLF